MSLRRTATLAALAVALLAGAGCGGAATITSVTDAAVAPEGYGARRPAKRVAVTGRGEDYVVFTAALTRLSVQEAERARSPDPFSQFGLLYDCQDPNYRYQADLRQVEGSNPPAFEFYVPRDPALMSVAYSDEYGGLQYRRGWPPEVVARASLCIEFLFMGVDPWVYAFKRFRDPEFSPIPARDFFR